ncbi:hypothetical protein BDF22DRAFT_741242 [Syncephalis plumigaleata]|nr:hypothetical protein BDF22DRAFT_741242 [Syncephalis plumigaleata]
MEMAMMESSHSSNLNENGVDIPASTPLATPSLSYAYSDSSATSNSGATNLYDDGNVVDDDDDIAVEDGSTNASGCGHAIQCNSKEMTSIPNNPRLSALSLNIRALSAMHSTAVEPSDEMLSSSFTSAVSIASLCSTVGVDSLASSSSYIRSRRRAPPTTLATPPVAKAIVIPSKTDAATYVAATIESFPKSMSSFSSYDDDMFYNSFKTSCYDKFRFIVTEFGVITHIKTKPAQITYPSSLLLSTSSAMDNRRSESGGGLAGLARACASALGIDIGTSIENIMNASRHQPSTCLFNATTLKWRWVWITIRQYNDFMICTLRRPLDQDEEDEEDEENECYDDGDGDGDDTSNSWTTRNPRRSTFIGLGEYLLSFLLPSNEDEEKERKTNKKKAMKKKVTINMSYSIVMIS